MQPDIIDKIKELASPLAEEKDLFLVDAEVKTGGGTEVWIYLDGENRSVNIDECAEISRELGFLIDAHELLGNTYRLNVSSPGLSRPLTDKRQYPKNVERTFKLRYRDEEEVQKMKGKLVDANDEAITLEGEDGAAVTVNYSDIIEAKIIPVI
tara:strand:+ start:121399 stop:121857 length:459 start_codon:yes stop_codon:yes gene_type:complete